MRKTTVADVMTRNPIAVTASTPFKELVQLLDRAQISAVPVVDQQNRVIGVVSEADLLRKHECTDLELVGLRRPPDIEPRAAARTAGELMTTPATTVGPDAFLPSATRLLTEAGVRRLYVVDGAGRLIGVASRPAEQLSAPGPGHPRRGSYRRRAPVAHRRTRSPVRGGQRRGHVGRATAG